MVVAVLSLAAQAAPAGARAPRHATRAELARTQTVVSEPWLHPPQVTATGQDPDPGAGDIFVDTQNSIQAGPTILDPNGQLIYFQALKAPAFNVEVQQYGGQSVLTYWTGQVANGIGSGEDVLLNHNYQTVATVQAGNGYMADLHEFQITSRNTALIDAFAPVNADLRSVGGSRNGKMLDSIIQEINVPTGQVLWQWRASQHISPAASYAGTPGSTPYDFFHLNSIQDLPGDRVLVSARHTWAVYEIDKRTGKILWTLGGKHSSFKMGPGTQFEWQHDAHMQPDGTITIFDNGSGLGPQHQSQSRALRIRLNFKTMRATLVKQFAHGPAVLSPNEGSVQVLRDGDTFVGWGGDPDFSEFGSRGRQRFGLSFPTPMQSYRAYRFPWWGQPLTPPNVAVNATSSGDVVYATWDGATDVAAWRVLAGPSATALQPVAQAPKTQFETAIPVSGVGPDFAVQAIGQDGSVLSTSSVTPALTVLVPRAAATDPSAPEPRRAHPTPAALNQPPPRSPNPRRAQPFCGGAMIVSAWATVGRPSRS